MGSLPKGTGESSMGGHSNICGHKSFSIFSGLNEEGFASCLMERTGLSNKCTQCYSSAARFGVANCKFACMASWCSRSCFECGNAYLSTLDGCTGMPSTPVEPVGQLGMCTVFLAATACQPIQRWSGMIC